MLFGCGSAALGLCVCSSLRLGPFGLSRKRDRLCRFAPFCVRPFWLRLYRVASKAVSGEHRFYTEGLQSRRVIRILCIAMSKEDALKTEGVVKDVLPGTMFRVQLPNGALVLA